MSNARVLSQAPVATVGSFKNRIINPTMFHNQRGAGAVTAATGSSFAVDRWSITYSSTGGGYQAQQMDDGPTPALRYSLKCSQITAPSTSLIEFRTRQIIELMNCRDLAGKKVAVSFWYKSNKTGTHIARIISTNQNSVTGATDSLMAFTVNTANVWEFKTVIFDSLVGITSWGASPSENSYGIYLDIGFSGTTLALNDYFQLTGVQLESGSAATPFEFRDQGIEYGLCRRYYLRTGAKFWGYSPAAGQPTGGTMFFPPMRTTPTLSLFNVSYGNTANAVAESVNNGTAFIYAMSSAAGQTSLSIFDSSLTAELT